MSWIATVPPDQATGRLRTLYDRVAGPDGRVDNILQAHGLRPHTLEGHMALYKAVLHHSGNRLPGWVLETIGMHVSLLNGCAYCVDHHFAGLRRLLADDDRASLIRAALEAGTPDSALDDRVTAAVHYAERLTREPAAMVPSDVAGLRLAGFDDGEILEINQVVSYFAYANRTVQGLGIDTHGDVLGHSPRNAEDPADWRHR